MKKFAALLLVFALLFALTACVGQNGAAFRGTASADAETVTSAAPTEPVAPSDSVAPSETVFPTEPDAPTEPTETTLPSETREDLEAAALRAEMEALFDKENAEDPWYLQALTSYFDCPEQVDLYPFFYNGIPGQDRIREEVGQCECMPRAEMDRVLSRYFGLTLEETAGRGLENFYYDAETDCCYHSHSDACSLNLRVDDVRKLEDGTVLFTYCNLDHCYYHNEDGLIWTAGLKPDGEGNYQFLFNLLGEWVTPEDLGE